MYKFNIVPTLAITSGITLELKKNYKIKLSMHKSTQAQLLVCLNIHRT